MPQNGQIPPQTFDLSAGVVPPTQTGKFDLSAGLSQPQNPASSIAPSFGASDLFGETLKGIGKGALKTGTEVGEAVNSMLPADARQVGISAETLAKGKQLSAPTNTMQELGMGIEDIGEWAAGDAAVKGMVHLARIHTIDPKIVQLAAQYPDVAKLLSSSAAKFAGKQVGRAAEGYAVGATKGALKGEDTSNVLGEANAGGLGGAAGSVVSGAVGDVLGGVGKAVGVGTEPDEDAIKALAAQKWDTKFNENWKTAAPVINKEIDGEEKFKDMQAAAKRVRQVANDMWAKKASPLVQASAGRVANVDSVAQALEDEVAKFPKNPQTGKIIGSVNQKKAEKLLESAKEFRDVKQLTLGEIEALAETNNNSLRASGMFNRSPSERHAMIENDGGLKGSSIANDELRSILAREIPGLQEIKDAYGATSHIATALEGRQNVAARQANLSFKKLVGMTAAATGHPLAAVPSLLDWYYNDPVKIFNRALAKEATAAGTGGAMQKVKSFGKAVAVKTLQATPKAVGEKAGETLKEEKSSQ